MARLSGAGSTEQALRLADDYGARNYDPLPVAIAEGEGAWVSDIEGRRYLDLLGAYSALNFGHRHPALVAAAHAQMERLTLTSRAFQNDQLGPFCEELATLCGMDLVLPMNTGAEAVETAIKLARLWGYRVKGVPVDRAVIVGCEGNFHGRTTTIVGFSSDPVAKDGFGPATPGFRTVPFGDAAALEREIDETTVAFLVEPIQGEAGVLIPPHGYLRDVRRICDARGVLMIADEIQSGLGRTGHTLACDYEHVRPDVVLLGKALGGGIVPISAVLSRREILGLLRPGQHGSTFGGNPLACAIARAVIVLLRSGEFQRRAVELGEYLSRRLSEASLPLVSEIRYRGLWFGVDLEPGSVTARGVCEALLAEGVLAKEAHSRTLRLAPPLVITRGELDLAVRTLSFVLERAAKAQVS
jgi:ornithine--oxo-acid transaminase